MRYSTNSIVGKVGAKAIMLIVQWGLLMCVTYLFAGGAKRDLLQKFVEQAVESGNSIVPFLASFICVIFVLVAWLINSRQGNVKAHALGLIADVAGDLGSALFLYGYVVLIYVFAKPSMHFLAQAAFGLLFGLTLMVASKIYEN
ncbi:hypothetical protein [Pseudoxanthomonas sp. JBR18]|uniref:hypothetical protein n=1 Tax=Pseudoxanthomonas sp. JBR18 TaxID=2969308 RepID=UPI002306239B|nr:hypothetical protein [Pseudoxanthomonas sp. JBR18]WCE06204.1 hypothetical protein PJ250_09760 [Pseudoxanthomonas sp. JBR18]